MPGVEAWAEYLEKSFLCVNESTSFVVGTRNRYSVDYAAAGTGDDSLKAHLDALVRGICGDGRMAGWVVRCVCVCVCLLGSESCATNGSKV